MSQLPDISTLQGEHALQAEYDRVSAHRARTLRYYDECPDGDPRKAAAAEQLREMNARISDIADRIEALLRR
jgi:hypothetical protein